MVAWTRGTRFFPIIGDQPADQPVFKIGDGRCIEASRPSGPLVVFGPEIPLLDFVAFTRREIPTRTSPSNVLLVPRDPSRIAVASWQFVGEDGAATGATIASYHDRKLGTKCEMKVAADGMVRCLPSCLVRIFFADARCTVPIVVPDVARPSTRWFPGRIVNRSNDGCGYGLRVCALRPKRPAPHATFLPGLYDVGCERVPDQPGRYFAVGPEIPPRHFVEFRESQPPRRHIGSSRKQ
jgi:hypothetical protein